MSLWTAVVGDGTFTQEVVGVASCQPELEELSFSPFLEQEQIVLALLILEDTNPYDRAAVRVQILGRTVGYLSRADARALRAWLGREAQRIQRVRCRAKLHRTGFPPRGKQWTVRLDVRLPQDKGSTCTEA